MIWTRLAGAAITTAVAAPIVAQSRIHTERVQFTQGATSATVKATIKGDQTVDYVLGEVPKKGPSTEAAFSSSLTGSPLAG